MSLYIKLIPNRLCYKFGKDSLHAHSRSGWIFLEKSFGIMTYFLLFNYLYYNPVCVTFQVSGRNGKQFDDAAS